jgi:hypothetical protein
MEIYKVLKDLETTIAKISRKLRNSETVSADKLKGLASLSNAYSRLVQQKVRCESHEKKFDPMEEGTPGYHESLYSE